MKTQYQIKVLSNEEFDMLPYKHAKDALGCADKENGVAYIRNTRVPSINEATMQHELQELLLRVSPHEEDGIRYKKFMDIFKPVLNVLSFVPQLAWLKPIVTVMNMVTTGVDIADRGFRPLDALSFAGPTLGAFKGISSGGGLAGAFKGGLGIGSSAAPTSLVDKYKPLSGAEANPFTDFGFNTVAGNTSNALDVGSNFGKTIDAFNVSSGLSNSLGRQSLDAILNAPATPSLGEGLATAGKEYVSGQVKNLATGAIANQLAPESKTPVSTGNEGALSRFGPQNLSTNFSLENLAPAVSQEDTDSAFNRISQNSFARTSDIFDQFRSTSPGSTPEGNTAFARALSDVNKSAEAERGTFLSEAEQANKNRSLQYQYKQLQNLNSLDDEKMNFYVNLANQGDDVIKQHIGNDVSTFRNVFAPLSGIKWS